MSDKRTAQQVASDNFNTFLDRGPGLWASYGIYVIARDPNSGMILKGGLGATGGGVMWSKETERDKERSGYADAAIVVYPGEPFPVTASFPT
jgi:hypothetical protein